MDWSASTVLEDVFAVWGIGSLKFKIKQSSYDINRYRRAINHQIPTQLRSREELAPAQDFVDVFGEFLLQRPVAQNLVTCILDHQLL